MQLIPLCTATFLSVKFASCNGLCFPWLHGSVHRWYQGHLPQLPVTIVCHNFCNSSCIFPANSLLFCFCVPSGANYSLLDHCGFTVSFLFQVWHNIIGYYLSVGTSGNAVPICP